MREIKFRAYHKIKKEWIRNAHGGFVTFGPINTLGDIIDPRDLVIQQYTGIKDRKNRELYEGDIVTYSFLFGEHEVEKSRGIIYFDEGIFYLGEPDCFAMNDCNLLKDTIEWAGIKVSIT